MGNAAHNGANSRLTVVACPRASDGVGSALRNAYARDAALPSELSRLLGKLDDTERMSRR